MTSTCVQGGLVKPLGGYQANVIMQPRSPATACQHPSVIPKQEPMEDERNNSGITSGSDFQSCSPGNENGQEFNISSQIAQSSPYYSRPVFPGEAYPSTSSGFNPLTPPDSEPMVSPKSKLENDGQDQDNSLTPCSSPSGSNDALRNRETQDDPLRSLQRAFETDGIFKREQTSPKPSENSAGDENKSEADEEEQNLRIPKMNSHGKMKTFKCKQCDFVGITKIDFWEHCKGHIKAEKRLNCPRCPFVTEYKHHLEYHLRNHVGSKPFKCDKCEYSCVNKSMLNSHMKSHSNIYQYRCADCHYATKYCHSLKMHLRKHRHKPAVVLNPDGTPNPLPIIDVYGTRRGPRSATRIQLTRRQDQEQQNASQQQNVLQHPIAQLMINAQRLQFPYPFLGGFPAAMANPFLFSQFAAMENNNVPQEENKNPAADVADGNQEALDLSRSENAAVHEISSEDGEASNSTTGTSPEPGKLVMHEEATHTTTNNNNGTSAFSCQFCDIAFGDVVLYTMHMGYHGFKNPFTCNMCGEECNDKVSFFLHIARTPHS